MGKGDAGARHNEEAMRAITVRLPEELLDWLREKAALKTIEIKKQYSINTLVVDILRRGMEADQKNEG
ncbi:MAG: hypothetical protein AAGU11_21745 [Syntrophobacteraceae bacterium]